MKLVTSIIKWVIAHNEFGNRVPESNSLDGNGLSKPLHVLHEMIQIPC